MYYRSSSRRGAVVARRVVVPEVTGSNPVAEIIFDLIFWKLEQTIFFFILAYFCKGASTTRRVLHPSQFSV